MQFTNIRYSITLKDEQYAYLTDEGQDIPRVKLLLGLPSDGRYGENRGFRKGLFSCPTPWPVHSLQG